MTSTGRLDAAEIREAARGRWGSILVTYAPELGEALSRAPRHVACPFHGGKADFRFGKDAEETGRAICTCGRWGDGFALLMHARGWNFREALEAVADFLGIRPGDVAPNRRAAPPPRAPAPPKVDPARRRRKIEEALNRCTDEEEEGAL